LAGVESFWLVLYIRSPSDSSFSYAFKDRVSESAKA
jgi:hypothetical protein